MSNSNDNNEQEAGNTIQLDNLSLEQLQQLRQREETQLQGLTHRYGQLRAAAARLAASSLAVTELEQAEQGSHVLVPLTESLYVPGKLIKSQRQPSSSSTQEPQHVPGEEERILLVELGTGYYAEKTTKETQEFLDRKTRIVQANSDNLTKAIQATQQNVQAIVLAMQGKLLEIRARKEGMRYQRQQQQEVVAAGEVAT